MMSAMDGGSSLAKADTEKTVENNAAARILFMVVFLELC